MTKLPTYFIKFTTGLFNIKSHDLYNIYFPKNFITLTLLNNEIIDFLIKNLNNNINIIFYHQESPTDYNNIINFLHSIKNEIKCNIFIFTFDFWYRKDQEHTSLINNVFKATNYKVITFCPSLEKLEFFINQNLSKYKNNIINLNIWSCYKNSYCNFNENPEKKIIISGRIIEHNYLERYILKKHNNNFIENLNYDKLERSGDNNNYSLRLNKYFASFSSSIYVCSEKTKNYENTHILLLKNFEILAAGCLLVVPLDEEIYYNNIGLYHNKNCYMINFKNPLTEQINNIFQNYDFYNNIRKSGYLYAKENLNSQKKYEEVIKVLNL